jgi:hypothetical protein
MPPKRKAPEIAYWNYNGKAYEMRNYLEKKYGMEIPVRKLYNNNPVLYDFNNPVIKRLVSEDKTLAKYKKQLEVLHDYGDNSIKQSMKTEEPPKKKAVRTLEKHLKGGEGNPEKSLDLLYNPKSKLAQKIQKRKFEEQVKKAKK